MLTVLTRVLISSCLVVLAAFAVLIKAECTGIELLVDGKLFSDDVLYKPVGSIGTFVRCLECDTNMSPNWFKSDVKISSCSESYAQSMICANSKNNISDLQFSLFLHPQRGSYTCSKHGNHKTLIIDVLEIPSITIHPVSLLTASDVEDSILNCEGTGKGMITYQWETSNINGGPWMKIGGDKRLVVRSPEQSQHYRCVVSNEAGIVRSDIATVTTLKITAQPVSPMTALEDVTLVCLSSVADYVRYSWHRVNGGIPYKSRGKNSSVFTIPRAIPHDEGVYYCKASKGGISVASNKIVVKVNDHLGINVAPKNLITSKGNTVQLIASASGIHRPHFVYQWKKRDSASLPNKVLGINEAVLTIPDVVESDEGQYYCIVTNEWRRSIKSDDITLTIHGSPIIRSITSPPTITTQPSSQLVTARTTFTLKCEATGEGSITYQWQTRRVNGEQWMNVNNSDSTRLNVSNLMEPQQYRCIASNEVGEAISYVSNVTILKIINVATHPNRLRDPGQSLTLTCISSVSNVTFSWAHDGRPITRPTTQTTVGSVSTLRITNIRNNDGGRYLCTVARGSLSVTALINKLIIYGAPTISIYPKTSYVPKGRSVTYQCRASGRNPLKYSWEQSIGSSWIPVKNNTVSYTTNATLDVGQYVYRCRVSNNGGPVVSKIITVNVYGPPNIIVHPSSQLITTNTNATLNCEAISNISIRYQWVISSNSGGPWVQINDSNGRNLVVSNISQPQHYRCVVSNQAGIATSSVATVTVLKIITHPQDKQVAVDSTVSFTCISSISSNITFSWTLNGVSITQLSLTTDDTSIITITRVSNSDTGGYMCNVSSGPLSVMSNTAILTVYDPPVVTYHPTSSSDVAVGSSITLTCRANGLGVLVYSWERSSGSSWTTVSNDNTTSYTTDTALAIGQYMYRCRVSNEAGSVVSNIATVNVYGPPTITTHPTSQEVLFGVSVILTCEGTGNGSITHQWETRVKEGQWMKINNSNNTRLALQNLEKSYQYRCIVSNEAGRTYSNLAIITILRRSSPPNNLTISDINVNSFELIWFPPTHPHGRIDHYIVRYNQFEITVKVADFNGTFTLDNLSPYTEYSIRLTAVEVTQATGESLESEESSVVTKRTLAGEPIIIALSQEAGNELILNPASGGVETFLIDLPVISTQNGPFSHLYIIVALSDHVINGVKSISTKELLKQSTYMFPLFYITAVVNASQFVADRRMMYALGAGDNTTDAEGHIFHNREVKTGFTYFFRVFSIDSIAENEISTTSDTEKIPAKPQNSGKTDDTNFGSLIIAVLAALLLALIVYAIIMSVWVFISRKQKKQSIQTTDGNDGQPIALKPIETHKCDTMSLSYNEEHKLENPAYVSIISKHPTITNTAKGLEKQASSVISEEVGNQATGEKVENREYATINPKQSPPDASVTNYQYGYSSGHHYETIQ